MIGTAFFCVFGVYLAPGKLGNRRLISDSVPEMNRAGIESTCDKYLELDWRCRALDRLFVDSLIAAEMVAYGNQILNEETYEFLPTISPLKQPHVLNLYLKIVATIAVLAGGAIASAMWIGAEWVFWIAVVIAGLLTLLTGVLTITLPFSWREQYLARRNARDLLSEMNGVYAQLRFDGSISASHIYKRLEEATSKGVVWPASVFVILDDILARDGRLKRDLSINDLD